MFDATVKNGQHEPMPMDLRTTWNQLAAEWVEWARDPGLDDDFCAFHLEAFMRLVPEPGRMTLDLAAGEGRITRELRRRSHRVIGVDSSPALTRAAVDHPDAAPAVVADAAKLPLPAASVDLAVAFMCLHDFDDLAAVGRQIKRVLRPGAALLIALLHPFVTGALVDSYSSEATYESTVATADKAMVYRGPIVPSAPTSSSWSNLDFASTTCRRSPTRDPFPQGSSSCTSQLHPHRSKPKRDADF